jgi:hypothetical protein
MFTGFPTLTPKLINTLELQGYTNFVKQDYIEHSEKENPGCKAFLFSPFKAFDMAEYYCKRLKKEVSPDFFNVKNPSQKKRLLEIAENSNKENCLAKIIEHNYKLGNAERNKIAAFMQSNYPQHFDLMIKNNFRIIIGDNFGEVFYKIRIGIGIIICINDSAL